MTVSTKLLASASHGGTLHILTMVPMLVVVTQAVMSTLVKQSSAQQIIESVPHGGLTDHCL